MKAPRTFAWLVPCLFGAALDAAAADYATLGNARLEALIEEALSRNPEIQAAAWAEAALRERIPTAGALPDPTLQLTGFAQSPQTRVGPQVSGVAVNQRLPWFGKRADSAEATTVRAQIQRELAAARRADVVRQVKVAYYELAYLDRAIAITGEQRELLEHYESLARARYSQGVGLQQAVVKLQAEITRVLNRRQELARQRVDVESGLNALRDRPAHAGIADVKLGALPRFALDRDRILAMGRDNAPEVKAAALAVDHDKVGVRLAERRYWPDLVLGATWGRIRTRDDEPGRSNPPPGNGKDTLGLTLGINIPLHRGIYDAGVREAVARRSAAEESHRLALNGVDQAVRSTGFALTTIETQIALIENALVPQAEQALRATEEAYATGTTGVLDLLDSEELLLDVRLGLARLKADYMRSLADMERAIGAPFPPRSQQ
ncbi:MAG: TolC family protein [Gammaproteobacteria bacterium]|nr:TolC family protein [Gammaproteobacteria bacterium]